MFLQREPNATYRSITYIYYFHFTFSIFCSVCYIQDLRALDIFGQQWIERSGDYTQEMILNWTLACALWLDNHY